MKRREIKLARQLLTALALAATVSVTTSDAQACGGGWWPEIRIDYRIQGIARAERDLNEGRHASAAASVIRMIPHIRNYKKVTRDPIINRALHVLAVATSRANGELSIERELPTPLHGEWLGKTNENRNANLRWSVATLRNANEAKKSDPVLQSELGEALAQLDEHRDEARDLLGKMAAKDLLTTPEAYATLAGLRAATGDENGRHAALQRCRAMAADNGICRVDLRNGKS